MRGPERMQKDRNRFRVVEGLVGKIGQFRYLLLGIGKGVLLSVLIAWLFYRDARGMAVLPVCILIMCRKEHHYGQELEKERFQQQFTEFLGFLGESMTAGYSLEHAIGEAGKTMKTTYGTDSFAEQLALMQRKLVLGSTVEEVFAEFAETTGCEEAKDFAEVLYIAKRTGGAVRQVIANTEGILVRKQETIRQIRGSMHSKLYENGVMKYMPFAMLLYLQVGMPDFLASLYHNPVGVVLMTVILLCYAGLCAAVDRISQIEV